MEDIKKEDLISFEAKDQLFDLTVFTDVDCGYCRKLHKEIQQYNPQSELSFDDFRYSAKAYCFCFFN